MFIDATLIYIKDLGDFGSLEYLGGPHHVSLDVSSYMDGNPHTLLFETTCDYLHFSSSFVDNVSSQAVPDPGTMAAVGLGALVLLRRRKK